MLDDVKIGDIIYKITENSYDEKYSKYLVIDIETYFGIDETYFTLKKVIDNEKFVFKKFIIQKNFITHSKYREIKLKKLI